MTPPAGSAQQAVFQGLDLQGQIARVDPALREAAGREPEPILRRPRPHVAQLAAVVEAPYRADAVGDSVAQCYAHELLLALVAGGDDDEVGRHCRAVAQ